MKDNNKWPYIVDISTNSSRCFYDQIIHINNEEFLNQVVYYYIISTSELIILSV